MKIIKFRKFNFSKCRETHHIIESELNIEKRIRIQILHQEGKSQVEIAKLLECSRSAAQSAIKRFAKIGSHAKKIRMGQKA